MRRRSSRNNVGGIPLHKVVMVGEGGVGKSAVTLMFMYGDFVEEYEPTKVDSYRKKLTIDEKSGPCQADILDTAGQEEYTAIRDNYYRNGEGFIILFSITDYESFTAIQDFYDHIYRVVGHSGDNIPIVLVGNKADLEQKRKVSRSEAQAKAQEWGCPYLETSAKTKYNIENLYINIIKQIISYKEKRDLSSKKRSFRCQIF